MIVFPGNGLGLVALGGLYHETFHQWWDANVTGANFDMAFLAEGMATLAVQMFGARDAEQKAGGPNTPAGRAAFERYLVGQFNSLYALGPGFWQLAPTHRSPATFIDLYAVYERPKAALLALRQILGPRPFDAVLHSIQRRYAGSSITEPQLEAAFAARLPDHSAACRTRLSQFFTQWFDTAYHGSKPQITGPGLHGHSFYARGCAAPGRR
jgi:aminopeptidase N